MAFGSLALLKKTGSCGTRAKALKQSSLKSPVFPALLSMLERDCDEKSPFTYSRHVGGGRYDDHKKTKEATL
jgi:hypothetical protein